MRLATIHNLHTITTLMAAIRQSITAGSLTSLAKQWGVEDELLPA
jgi:tRNA-guanine family transglycosylase